MPPHYPPHLPSQSTTCWSGPGVLGAAPRSPLDWVDAIRRGLPSAAVDALTKITHLSQSELAAAVGIPSVPWRAANAKAGSPARSRRGWSGWRGGGVRPGEEVFEDLDAAVDGLQSPNASLGGRSPLSLLDTDIGAESVMDTRGRIEHGVFA